VGEVLALGFGAVPKNGEKGENNVGFGIATLVGRPRGGVVCKFMGGVSKGRVGEVSISPYGGST